MVKNSSELGIHDLAWQKAYQLEEEKGTLPSWARHGLPYLFEDFIKMVKESGVEGEHIDIGCGDAVKTVNYPKNGLKTIGVDISPDAIRRAKERAVAENIDDSKITFTEADCRTLALPGGSLGSLSDSLVFTHIDPKDWKIYGQTIDRLLKPGAHALFVLFHAQDPHFHGTPITKKTYVYEPDLKNPITQADITAGLMNECYPGMINIHFDENDIDEAFTGDNPKFLPSGYEIVAKVEHPHPVYSHRKLWNVIVRKTPQ